MLQILSRVMDSLPGGILVYDEDEVLIFVNKIVHEVVGADADLFAVGETYEQLLRKRVARGSYPEAVGRGDAFVAERLARRRRGESNSTVNWKNGAWYSVDEQPLDGGGTVVLITDVTKLKLAETMMVEARDAATEADRVRLEFLANVSHEIRTPMNSVIGFTKLLQTSDLNDEQADHVTMVDNATRDLMSLIDDILDFSKLESRRFELETVPFDLAREIAEAFELARVMSDAQGLALSLQNEVPSGALLLGDARRLRQVLLNLLSNATKFTEAGSVSMRASTEPIGRDRVIARIEVADTGIGIGEDKIAGIFDPFVQADGSIARRYFGTGLGLSITRHLVELMGGRIEVESESGRGSLFVVEVPLAIAEKAAESESQAKLLVT
jgi:hypothetical protein